MKIAILLTFAAVMLVSCNDSKTQEKALLNDVMKTHDKLMSDDGLVMKNKMQLKNITAAPLKDSVAFYNMQLGAADDAMMMWMNKFSPDFKGKSHEQIMAYLNTQKSDILKLDSQITTAITASSKFINQNKGK